MRINKIHKIIIIVVLLFIMIVGAYKACKIDTLTHLSKNDLEWISRYHTNDILFFKNMKNQIDTMIVKDIKIYNSTFPFMNPFLKLETGSYYIAYTCLFFEIHHQGQIYESSWFVYKDSMEYSPTLSWRIGNFVSEDKIPTKFNCMVGNTSNSRYIDNSFAPKDSLDYIQAFEWCKNSGLRWYQLRNGETFHLYKQ